MVFVREGSQWQNSFPIDVDTDLEYVELSFLENGAEGKVREQMSALRFDGPFVKGEHPLVLSLTRRQVSLTLTLVAAGTGETAVKVLDVIGVGPDRG